MRLREVIFWGGTECEHKGGGMGANYVCKQLIYEQNSYINKKYANEIFAKILLRMIILCHLKCL